MKDIIALAKEAGFYTGKNHIFGAGKGKDTYYSDGLNYIRVTDALNKLAALLEAEIRKEFEVRITDLEDALDHIKKIAGMARVPTKRLDWIEARASMALLNEPWDKDYKPLPKNANSSRNAVRHLTEQNAKLMEEKREASENMLRLIADVRYVAGIAERGRGKPLEDGEKFTQVVLDYVKSLEAQNTKLMEALKHCHEVFVKYEINRIDGDEISDKAISIIMEALTPQPEKEVKE